MTNFRLPECHKVNSQRIKVLTRGTFDEMVVTQTQGTFELSSVGIITKHEAVELTGDVEAAVVAMAEPFAEGSSSISVWVLCSTTAGKDHQGAVSVTDNMTVLQRTVKVHCRHALISQCIGWIGDATTAVWRERCSKKVCT